MDVIAGDKAALKDAKDTSYGGDSTGSGGGGRFGATGCGGVQGGSATYSPGMVCRPVETTGGEPRATARGAVGLTATRKDVASRPCCVSQYLGA